MRTQSAPPLVHYTKSLDVVKSQGGTGREAEYYEHYRNQGVVLRLKYRKPS